MVDPRQAVGLGVRETQGDVMKCPRCGRPSSKEVSHRQWFCHWCDMLFDDADDDGEDEEQPSGAAAGAQQEGLKLGGRRRS